MRRELKDLHLDQLADRIAHGASEWLQNNARAELLRRQTVAQIEATEAQKVAAEAARDASIYAKMNALYMLLSVIAIFITSGATAIFAYFAWQFPHQPH
jgi:hypothetical protein